MSYKTPYEKENWLKKLINKTKNYNQLLKANGGSLSDLVGKSGAGLGMQYLSSTTPKGTEQGKQIQPINPGVNENTQKPIILKKYTNPTKNVNLGQLNAYNFSGSYSNANNSGKYSLSDYINNQKASIQTSVYDLLNRKYGKGNYDPNKGWNQDAPTVEGWNDLQDEQGLNAYLKLMQDRQNLDLTSGALRSAENVKNQAYAEQDILRQQAEKYVPNQLRASGMGNVGTSESSRVGIYNQYARNLNDISKETNNTIQGLVSQYQQAVNEGNTNLANQQISLIKEYQDVAFKNAQEVLLSGETYGNLEQVKEYIDSLENVLTSEQWNYLNSIYAVITRSLQESKQEGKVE